MKTSNKIIVYFLTFAWLSVMASLLISNQFSHSNTIKAEVQRVDSTDALGKFSVVKIEQAARLKIVQGDNNEIRYNELIRDSVSLPMIKKIQELDVRNDTLFIKNLQQGSNGGYILVVSNLKHLMVYNTWELDLVGFDQDSLSITSLNSKVVISKKSEFSYLHLKSGRKFDLVFSSPRELAFNQTDSRVELSGEVDKISGVVGNYAELIIPSKIRKLDLDTSENGKLTLK